MYTEQLSGTTYLTQCTATRQLRRLIKRLTRRKRRRAESKDLENVPPRVTRGWAD